MQIFTNYDAQQVLTDTRQLNLYIDEMGDVLYGGEDIKIHLYALKQLLVELQVCRQIIADLRNK